MPMLEANVNSFTYPEQSHPTISDCELCVEPGQVACVVGASGAGKTTLLRILLGLFPAGLNGQVKYHVGDDTLSPDRLRKRGRFGVMMDGHSLLPWATVRRNITLPAALNSSVDFPSSCVLEASLEAIGLSQTVLDLYPHQLSFGMRQRVAFVRATVFEPTVLLLDEAFSGLDTVNADLLQTQTGTFVKQSASIAIVITHDIDRAVAMSDRLFYLATGGRLEHFTSDAELPSRLRQRMYKDVVPSRLAQTSRTPP